MIRPIPRHYPQRQSLSYPKYGEFGFEEPVGRKHVRGKMSAIHKIIFNEQVEPISRGVYNDVKLNLNGSFLDESIKKSSRLHMSAERYGQLPLKYRKQNQQANKKSEYDNPIHNDYLSKIPGFKFNIIQNQYSERQSLSNSRTNRRQDSLDSILNPYKNSDIKREYSSQHNHSYQNYPAQNGNKNSKDFTSQYSPVLSQRYNLSSIEQHRTKNPTFLNSLF